MYSNSNAAVWGFSERDEVLVPPVLCEAKSSRAPQRVRIRAQQCNII